MGGACSTIRGAYRVLVGRPEDRRPPGRRRRRWDDRTKRDFQEVIRGVGMNWIGLAERRSGHVAGCCQYGTETPGSAQCRKLQLRTCLLLYKDSAPCSESHKSETTMCYM